MTDPRPTGLRAALHRWVPRRDEVSPSWKLVSTPEEIPLGYTPPVQSHPDHQDDGDPHSPQTGADHDERLRLQR